MATNWDPIGHANNVVAMAALVGKLFAATSDNRLWWRDPVGHDVNWEEIGHANNVVAMAALGGKLFAATGDDRLWWRDPMGHDVNWEEIGHANNVVAMTALVGKLFAATSDNRLWWRDPVGHDVNWEEIGHATSVVAMAALGGKLFAATSDNRLWWREPIADADQWTQWPSIPATPPSRVYPPDGAGTWFARTDIPQTLHVQALGRDLAIVEVRGWLTEVKPEPNLADPDWHYILELDVEWLRTKGIDPVALLRPGDILGYPDDATIARRRSRIAAIEIEVDGWPRKDSIRGTPPQPSDWIKVDGSDVAWPWNPTTDVREKKLAAGQYVKMWGSLVTDHPHERSDQIVTNMILQTGLAATKTFLETADPDNAAKRLQDGAASAAKWIFIESADPGDPANPSRWNEIHSPDYVEILPTKERNRQLHQVIVCAQNGLFEGTTEQATLTLDAPAERPPSSRLQWREYPTSWTRPESVTSGPDITASDDHIEVSVTVRGDGGWGRSGKFYSLFELWWEKIPISQPSFRLRASVEPGRVGEGTHNISVSARDSGSGAPVAGRVLLEDQDLAATNVSFREAWEKGAYSLTVRCPRYPEVTVKLTVISLPRQKA